MLGFSDRKPDQIVHGHHPYNAEPRLDRLRRSYVTGQPDFYVRSHGHVPAINQEQFRLSVGGLIDRPLELSLDELKAYSTTRSVTATLQCAGNRRADLQQVRPVAGDPWAPAAIGNAEWTGIALADLLEAVGAARRPEMHVAFSAADEVDLDGHRFRFGVSIPMAKAMSPEVILAWAMNGEALTPEHGFPLRAVVPGYAGVRSPKWLASITVQDTPSDNHMQQRDYKLFPPAVSAEDVDWDRGTPINEMPLTSAICEPQAFSTLPVGANTIRGYAYATGRAVTRVDVSIDGGRTWQQATLEHDPEAPWSWTFWSIVIELPKGEHEIAVRAWDSAGQTQPALPDDVWNFKGYLSAAWHRIRVQV